jgi:hypothetical protein
MARRLRRLILIVVPATLLATIVAAALVELWVRTQWDDRRGTPGFYVRDAVLGQRLNAGYRGWFAGVPVSINALGFRDTREYSLSKARNTFRILILGDSVTFGHGALFETTYPYLVEQRLKAWRRDVNWEVWNLGVPGYNTADELAYLKEVRDRFQPDLVVVGWFPNDITFGIPTQTPGRTRRASAAVQRELQRHFYSYEFYRRALLTLRWRLMSVEDRTAMERLAEADDLLKRVENIADAAEQRIGDVDYFDDQQIRDFACPRWAPFDGGGGIRAALRDGGPAVTAWTSAVREFQRMHREGEQRIMFFLNLAPVVCQTEDRFHDGGSLAEDDALQAVMGKDTPVASVTRAFLHYRPSQMPVAGGHALGNANRVKADVLAEYLQSTVLPPLLDTKSK